MENISATGETSLRRSKRRRTSAVAEEVAGRQGEKPVKASNAVQDSPGQSGRTSEESDDFVEIKPGPRKKANAGQIPPRATKQNLIDIIKNDEKNIPDAVRRWVQKYEKNSRSAIVELLMTLFEACGAKYQLLEASLDDTSVDDVILDLVVLARKGEIEDWYASKWKEYKNLKENLALFWDNLVIECQNGALFDGNLFEKCMDYIIALSCTPPRIYRFVGTLVGLQLVTSFITVAKALASQRETSQRQLNTEKKKKNDGPRIESLGKRLTMTHEKITVIEEMMRKIFTGLFMHRYRDIDPEIRQMSIRALGDWIISYPSLFLQDTYLKYLGWTLNDKVASVRKASVLALQNLYQVDDIVPSLGLFTERFCNRMIELADDIDISVAVCAIGLLKQLLRHQLLADDELGPLYDLLIDEPPAIRRAVGELVYDHLIAQKFIGSQSGLKGDGVESSEIHLVRMLQILREFATDPILSSYVIDDVWDDMKAMRDWKCIISMLLDEKSSADLTDVDATSLVRLLYSSIKKAVGEKIIPAVDSRKQFHTKAQKEILVNSKKEITSVMIKSYTQLLRKYLADKEKVPLLVEIITYLKLDFYSLKRQEQNFKTVIRLVKDAFFKHGDREALRSCVKAITFCATESHADLQDFVQNQLKELESELLNKLKIALKEVAVGDDEYSLLVNLKRLYELHLSNSIPIGSLYEDMADILNNFKHISDEVVGFILLNMYLHVAWSLKMIESEVPSEEALISVSSMRDTLFGLLERFLDCLIVRKIGNKDALVSRVVAILAELWCLFKKEKFLSTKFISLGFCPQNPVLQKFWSVCLKRLEILDETEDEDINEEYVEETNRDAVMIAASKLVATETAPKDYLGPEIISHFVMHGQSITEIVKHLISVLLKKRSNEIPDLFLEAMHRAYRRHVEMISRTEEDPLTSRSLLACKDLATKLSAMFTGGARRIHRLHILKILKDGIAFAFVDAPKQLPFLVAAVLPFVSKLPPADIVDTLKDVEGRAKDFNKDEDPSGWRPYRTFVDYLQEKYAKNEPFQDAKGENSVKRRGRPKKLENMHGKKLFTESSGEESISGSDQEDQEEEHSRMQSLRSSASKLRLLRVPLQERGASAVSGASS